MHNLNDHNLVDSGQAVFNASLISTPWLGELVRRRLGVWQVDMVDVRPAFHRSLHERVAVVHRADYTDSFAGVTSDSVQACVFSEDFKGRAGHGRSSIQWVLRRGSFRAPCNGDCIKLRKTDPDKIKGDGTKFRSR